MYECTNNQCKGKNIRYCVVCANKKDESFKVRTHNHELLLTNRATSWTCNGTRDKDGCKCNNKTSGTGVLRFRCQGCDYDHCEYCLCYYHES